MRWGAVVRGLKIAALLWMAAIEPSFAQQQTPIIPQAPAADLNGGARADHFLLFSGFDIWRFGYSGYAGIQWAPQTIDRDGFILRLFTSDGVERYDSGSRFLRTDIFRASLLPGWRVKTGDLEIKLFAGPDFENDAPDSPASRIRGNHIGARAAAEVWWEPTPAIMVSSSFAATTIGNGYSARAATGWRLLDRFWAGPEISASGDAFSKQFRVGAHLTGFKTAMLEWSVAAGYVRDSFSREGAYGRIGVSFRQ